MVPVGGLAGWPEERPRVPVRRRESRERRLLSQGRRARDLVAAAELSSHRPRSIPVAGGSVDLCDLPRSDPGSPARNVDGNVSVWLCPDPREAGRERGAAGAAHRPSPGRFEEFLVLRRRTVFFSLILGAGLFLAGPAAASGPPEPGEPARPFTLADLDGRPVTLSSLRAASSSCTSGRPGAPPAARR